MLNEAVALGEECILLYFLLVNSFYALVLLGAGAEMRRHQRETFREQPQRLLGARIYPRISILSPAHNEESTIADSVRALLNHHYPEIEVVVVDDGSKDGTLEVLRDTFQLYEVEPSCDRALPHQPLQKLYLSRQYPNLKVASKANGGKSDALNLGVLLASGELTCVVDADTLLEPDALQKLVRPFLFRADVLAAGGSLRVVNGSRVEQSRVVEVCTPRAWLTGIQAVEYVRAFFLGRLGLNRLGGNLIISGAFGLFRRASILEAGGYSTKTVGEDMELVVRSRKLAMERGQPSWVAFVPDPVAWTEAPSSRQVLHRQRDRWQRGLADSLWQHRNLFLNPAYGAMGLISYPYQLFIELLSPMVEALGWLLLVVGLLSGQFNSEFALGFWLAAYGYGLLLTLLALMLEQACFPAQRRPREVVWLVVWALAESIGYRQLTTWARLQGTGRWFLGKSDWGRMERVGFRGPKAKEAPSTSVA